MLGVHSGSVSCCSQAQAESIAMIGVWLGAGGAQPSRDAQGAGPGPAAQHPAIVTVLLVCSGLLEPHHKDGAAPSLTGVFTIQSSASEALKNTPNNY